MNNMFLPQTDMVRWMDMTDFSNEKWKDAVGFENVLQISNIGRVKRKAFNHTIFNG